MHILLTDILTCPRCGPSFGLIVLADRIEDRRVMEGRLGCANCRTSYPVMDGVADLRVAAVPPLELRALSPDPERAYRLAALIGIQPHRARVLVIGATSDELAMIASLLQDSQVVGASSGDGRVAPNRGAETQAADELVVGHRIPFRSASFSAIALAGPVSDEVLREALRLLAAGGRLVIDGALGTMSQSLREMGFDVQLEQDETVVAAAPGHR